MQNLSCKRRLSSRDFDNRAAIATHATFGTDFGTELDGTACQLAGLARTTASKSVDQSMPIGPNGMAWEPSSALQRRCHPLILRAYFTACRICVALSACGTAFPLPPSRLPVQSSFVILSILFSSRRRSASDEVAIRILSRVGSKDSTLFII